MTQEEQAIAHAAELTDKVWAPAFLAKRAELGAPISTQEGLLAAAEVVGVLDQIEAQSGQSMLKQAEQPVAEDVATFRAHGLMKRAFAMNRVGNTALADDKVMAAAEFLTQQ